MAEFHLVNGDSRLEKVEQSKRLKDVEDRVNGFSSELSGKATKDELNGKASIIQLNDGLALKRDKSVKLIQSDLSTELLQQITGSTPVNTIPQDNSVNIDRIDDFLYDVVTKGKTLENQTFLVPSAGTSFTGLTNSYIIDKPIPNATIIKRIKLNSNGAVNTRVSVLKKISETSFKCVSVVSFLASVGEQTYNVNLPVPESGLYLCVSGRVRYLSSNASNPDAYGLYDVPSNVAFVSGDTITVAKSASIIQFGVQAYLDYETEVSKKITTLSDQIEALEANSGLVNPLYGKTVLVIGDSISDETNLTYCNVFYYHHLKNVDGLNYLMDGRSGTGYVRPYGSYANIPTRIDAYSGYNPDYVVFFAGTNDWRDGGVPLGVKGDNTMVTFYGALKITYDKIIAKYPLAKVVVATPIRRKVELDGVNANGNSLREYRDAIVNMAFEYSFTVLDLYSEGGINATLSIHRNNYFALLSDGSRDGTHPNNAGQERLYPKMRMALLQA